MEPNLAPISIVRQLRQLDLFYFTPRMLSDLFTLDLPRVYRLVARLKEDGLIMEAEKGKYLLPGFGTRASGSTHLLPLSLNGVKAASRAAPRPTIL
jgi:DNA-binding IclR family transcriptional regulator